MPTRLKIYILSSALLAILVAVVSFGPSYPLPALPALVGFSLLSFLAAQFPLTLPTGALYDVSFVITIAAIIAAGPATAVTATLFATVSVKDARRRHPLRHLFNASELVISAGIASFIYYGTTGPEPSKLLGELRLAVPALVLATLANFVLNTGLVSGAVALNEKRRFRDTWRHGYHGLAKNYIAFALLGLLLAIVYLHANASWAPVLFLLMPLLVARQAFQAAITMQNAYDDTVRSLISAFEAKDPYTRGHAERVSELAELTARAYGLSEDRCRAIRYAALMHDVGKLTVQSSVLKKPGKLTAEEYEHMKLHPLRGVEIVSEIDLIQEVLVGVRHHHERLDGKGYPDGLAGDEIPLFARLITVADAFDSMTSTRVYRKAKSVDEAFEELHRWSGVMFDPKAIAALKRGITQRGWTPVPEPRDEHEEVTGPAHHPAAL